MNQDNKEWRVIKEFPNYFISEYGDIYSTYKSGKFLSPKEDKDGYYEVCLIHNKVRHCRRVHRLVGMTFLENKDNLPLINHKDLNVKNNHYSNLEWCTVAHNNKHYHSNVSNKKVLSSFSKEDLLEMISQYKSGKSQKEVALMFGLESRPDVISEIVTGRRFSELTGVTRDINFEQRTTSKLTDEVVLTILEKYYKHGISQKELCSYYCVSPAQISRILDGSRRKSLYEKYFNTTEIE